MNYFKPENPGSDNQTARMRAYSFNTISRIIADYCLIAMRLYDIS